MMMFNCPLVPSMSHGMQGSFSSPHHMHSGLDVKTPVLIHADEDAYASLPPTPTSPFDLAGPHSGWPSHHHHHPLAPPAPDCGRGMYGMPGGMGGGLAGDVAIAGTGQFMNVSGYVLDICDCGADACGFPALAELHGTLRTVRRRRARASSLVRNRAPRLGHEHTRMWTGLRRRSLFALTISAAPPLFPRARAAHIPPVCRFCALAGRIALPSWSSARTLAWWTEWTRKRGRIGSRILDCVARSSTIEMCFCRLRGFPPPLPSPLT